MTGKNKFAIDISKAFEKIKKEERWAVADALTAVGKEAVAELEKEVQRVFDRPSPFIIKGFYSTRANERKLKIVVGIKDNKAGPQEAGKRSATGNSAATILQPHIEGGQRFLKGMEFHLRQKGLLQNNEWVVPGVGLSKGFIDKYGNVKGSKVVQILSALKSFTYSGYDANVTAASLERKRRSKSLKNQKQLHLATNIFVIRSGSNSHLKPGIYLRKSKSSIVPMFLFVRTPHYKRRFNFEQIVTDVYNKRFPIEVRKEIAARMK